MPIDADSLTPDTAAQLRNSAHRATRLEAYVTGLLPSTLAAKVTVKTSTKVPTAFVTPTDPAERGSADDDVMEPANVRALTKGTNAEYLIVISSQPANTDRVCLDDQLTADCAKQFALALHETLHIIKTSFGPVRELLEERVAEPYQDFVDRLINCAEDGAIEHEARTGDDFTDHAATRIAVLNDLLTPSVAERAEQKATYSLADAVTTALYSFLIFHTGALSPLLDPADPRLEFATQRDRSAFVSLLPELAAFSDDIRALRSDQPEALYDDDTTASVQRAKRTIRLWTDTLKPHLKDVSEQKADDDTATPPTAGQSPNQLPPQAVDVDTLPQDVPQQSVTSHPAIGSEPSIDDHQEQSLSPSDGTDNEIAPSDNQQPPHETSPDFDEDNQSADLDSTDTGEAQPEPGPSASEQRATDSDASNSQSDADSASQGAEDEGSASADDADRPETTRSDSVAETPQATLGDFQDTPQESDTPKGGNQEEDSQSLTGASADEPSPSQPQTKPSPDSAPSTSEEDNSDPSVTPDPDSTQSPMTSEDLSPADFDRDRAQSHQEAEAHTVDSGSLAEDVQALNDALQTDQPNRDNNGRDTHPRNEIDLADLEVMPAPEENTQTASWQTIEQGAERVADTLAKTLRLNQQTATRTGLSAGQTVNTKTAHRLGYGDPRVFETDIAGDDKDYLIVFILDRSISMREAGSTSQPHKIELATRAVTQFAVACEQLGINVAVIDFYNNEPRYVKPPSVDTAFIRSTLLDTSTSGRTPLARTLSLARTVAEAADKQSLIISVTDDQPNDLSATKAQLTEAFPPVCSLTIATNHTRDDPPANAKALESAYEQTTTVFEPDNLTDKIDGLASLLSGY